MHVPGGWLLAAALALLAPAGASACDACLDGRIAASIDHAVNRQAASDGDMVVYCEISGPVDALQLTETLRRIRGVQPQSLRLSDQQAELSFAVDAKLQSPQSVVDTAQAGIGPGTRLRIVRVLTTLPPVSGVQRAAAP